MNFMSVVPAYGRAYKTKDQLMDDWNNGKDFRIESTGTYFSIRDTDALVHTLGVDTLRFLVGGQSGSSFDVTLEGV